MDWINGKYVKLKEKFNSNLLDDYYSENIKIFSDLPKSSFDINTYTILYNDKPVGLCKSIRPKKFKIFDTTNWILYQAWIKYEYKSKGIMLAFMKYILVNSQYDFILTNIHKTKTGLTQFIKNHNGLLLKPSSAIYLRLDINPSEFQIFYFDQRSSNTLKEDINFSENDISYMDKDVIISNTSDNKQKIIKLTKSKLSILPYKYQDKQIYVLVETDPLLQDLTNISPITTYIQISEDKNNNIIHCLDKCGYKLLEPDLNKLVKYHGNLIMDNFIKMDNFCYSVNLTNKQSHNGQSSNSNLAWIPVNKLINKCLHLTCLALVTKIIKLVLLELKYKNSEKIPEEIEIQEMSVSGLVSYEGPKPNNKDKPKIFHTMYPDEEDFTINQI